MIDPRRRQATVSAGLAVGALLAGVCSLGVAGCGGHGGAPGEGASGESTETRVERSDHVGRAATRVSTPAEDLVDDPHNPAQPPEASLHGPFLCTRDPVAFDLSKMTPVDPSSAGFRSAWIYQQDASDFPGFVVAYSGTFSGPVIHAAVGSVYSVAPNTFAFMHVLPGGEPEEVARRADDPFLMSSYSAHEFITAFGTERERQGFVVSTIAIDGRLDSRCQSLRDVRVTMTLPKSNIGQHFGGTTMDAALGPMTVDTDGDGTPDSWSVTLAASSLRNLMFRL